MREWLCCSAAIASAVLGFSSIAQATTVTYEATPLGGGDVSTAFTVANDDLGIGIEQFTIFLPVGQFDNVSILNSPIDWDGLAIDPDPVLPDDGFVDWLALGSPIAPGDELGGFTAQFTVLPGTVLGDLFFQIIDPTTLQVLDDGFAVLDDGMGSNEIPVPAAAILYGTGLFAMSRRQRGHG